MSDDTYSISQARDQLARLVHDAEGGRHIELTRRGRPVAVVLAIDEYRKLSAPRTGVWSAISRFRSTHDLAGMDDLADELTTGTRSSEPGRGFSW
jgi:prevent-host-death family protein